MPDDEVRHDVMADTGKFTEDGRPMWAHRPPTPEEEEIREALAPWFNHDLDEKGERIKLQVYLDQLHGRDDGRH